MQVDMHVMTNTPVATRFCCSTYTSFAKAICLSTFSAQFSRALTEILWRAEIVAETIQFDGQLSKPMHDFQAQMHICTYVYM